MSKKSVHIFIFVALFFLIAIGGSFLAKRSYGTRTDGFSLSNIASGYPYNPDWDIRQLTAGESEEVENALSQEYTYLGKGHQAYVFESQDKQYVIKFLKFQKYRNHPLIEMLPLPSYLNNKRLKKAIHKEEKRDALFNSWKIAFDLLKDDTGVLWIHLNTSMNTSNNSISNNSIFNNPISNSLLRKKLTLFNKSGVSYSLDLNQYVFLLQKKAEMWGPTIEAWMSKGNIEETKQLIDQLLQLYMREYHQGILENDRYIIRNTGVIDNRPIQIDTGRLKIDGNIQDFAMYSKEIQWKTTLLKEWLEELYPELADHLNNRLNQITTAPFMGF